MIEDNINLNVIYHDQNRLNSLEDYIDMLQPNPFNNHICNNQIIVKLQNIYNKINAREITQSHKEEFFIRILKLGLDILYQYRIQLGD